jgi:hypothetical protein
MNRRARRRSAAIARGRRVRPGYLHRIVAALGDKPTPGLHHAAIEHDPACSIHRRRPCDCVPDISVSGPDGVTVIDEMGRTHKVAKQ